MILNAIYPFEELVAYETLWANPRETLKNIKTQFLNRNILPSAILNEKNDIFYIDISRKVREFLKEKKGFSICLKGDLQYPERLLDANYPLELFYYKGDIELLSTRCVSIVGSRKITDIGKKKTFDVVKALVKKKFTIVSGLAKGIDTHALNKSLSDYGKVIGVIGTPIDRYYPKDNLPLQNRISQDHLLISQVPFYRYANEHFNSKKYYFPERNVTMSAISEATIIIEASETSGTRIQARACIDQKNRKLFLMKNIVDDKRLTWPKNYVDKGAIIVDSAEDIIKRL